MFAGISRRYDFLNRLLSLGIDRGWRRRTVAAVSRAVPAGGAARRRVLDLCCGTGDLALELAAEGFEVTGLDFCHEMLVIGRDKAGNGPADAPGTPPRMVEADALSLPFPDASYDGATAAFGVRNLADLNRGLAEAARVLRPGGVLAILEFAQPRNRTLAALYRIYLNGIVPLVGRLVSRDDGAYGYLSTSIQAFEDQSAFPKHLERAGFTSIRCDDLTGGVAALYTARKPASRSGSESPERPRLSRLPAGS
jgi:demethylmenaquinone methyltransferase/2-methoxy-6-polyprenyl-1,4-benzoquinol methylase